MPFMPEMEKFCGRVARVYRCVDKVYDYGFSKRMRRIDDTVLLLGLRCDGQGHGGCEAACYLIWKTAWLEPVTTAGTHRSKIDPVDLSRPQATTGQSAVLDPRNSQDGDRFRCQLTEMRPASVELSAHDLRKEIKPLLAGNVRCPPSSSRGPPGSTTSLRDVSRAPSSLSCPLPASRPVCHRIPLPSATASACDRLVRSRRP